MSTLAPPVGVSYYRDNNGFRPIPIAQQSAIFLVGTAPDADKDVFPINQCALMVGRDEAMLAKLGVSKGTLHYAIDAILSQGVEPYIIVVRVERAPKPKTSFYHSIKRTLSTEDAETVNRASDSDEDTLAHSDIGAVEKIWSGDDIYARDIDWVREGAKIKWKTYETVETVLRRTSTTDPLDFIDNALELVEVSQGETQYVVDTDCQLTENGIEWVTENKPVPHTTYLATYRYGRRPANEQDYQVKYTYYPEEEILGELVNRDPIQIYDYLANNDILRLLAVRQGNTTYIAETDYKLANDRIEWQIHTENETVTRGAGNDALIHSANLQDISEISMSVDIFTKDVDWQITANEIEWLGNPSEPELGEDYVVSYTHAHKPANDTDYECDYEFVGGEYAALSNVVGGWSADTGLAEGVNVARYAEEQVKVKPKLMVATGFTQYSPVVNEMLGVASDLLSVVIADGPTTSPKDSISYRQEFGSERCYVIDPWVKFYNTYTSEYDYQPSSAMVAGLINKVDEQKGVWYSPSNHELLGIEGLKYPVGRQGKGQSIENYLRQADVNTITRGQEGGWMLAGNRTCSNDPQFQFLPIVRTDDLLEEAITNGLQVFRDRPIDVAYITTLVESLNAFLRTLAQKGAIILGAQPPAYVVTEDNSPDQIKLGRFSIKFDCEFKYPAESILVTREINFNYLEEMFKHVQYVRDAA